MTSSVETFLSCTAADCKNISPGGENCVEVFAEDAPKLLRKTREKTACEPQSLRKIVQKLCSHNLHAILRLSGVIRANRKFECFRRIGMTHYKNRGFNRE